MRYFRFKSKDIDKTIDFYTTFGMSVKYDGEQECVLAPVPPIAPQPIHTYICRLRKDSTLDSKYIPQSDITDRPVTQPKTDSFIPAHHGAYTSRMETKVQHNYEYLVIYVHFIHRLVKRFSAKGYDIVLPPTELDSMKLCILKDPNGIEVRLYDMPDSLLNERNSKTRLGYYAIPTSYANDTALMYEALFQIRTPKSLVGKEMGAVGTVRQAISKAQGFRLVDMDEFSGSQQHGVLLAWKWSMNICVHNLLDRRFEVPNLDAVIHKLKYETKDQLKWSNVRHKMTGVGMVAKFKDRSNGLALSYSVQKQAKQYCLNSS
ncbi:hypothetical protein BSLG_005859 [Batrachochytrium salamandrivorans]|nr:hypothetical protein BSLG_005859 [Batrachochytrium salamandrivorans]